MYNASQTIERCVRSVINQSYSNIEIIVVNDGSKDNSLAVLKELVDKEEIDSISIIDKLNGGVSSARNAGLRNAKGEIIALLDSDDEWEKNKIEKQLQIIINNPAVDFVACNSMVDKIDRFLLKKFDYLNTISVNDLIFKNYFQPSTVIFKSKILSNVGFFDETQKYAEEGNYFLRVASKYNCVLMNERLIVYGDGKAGFGESGLSANLKEMEKGELRNINFAFKNKLINTPIYALALFFSVCKYVVRCGKVKLRKINVKYN